MYTYRVTVYRRNLSAQFQPGGQGGRWLDKLRLAMHRKCESNAPVRSGDILKSHRSSIRGVNQYRAEATVSNISDHALYVHEGTAGARSKKLMVLPPGGPGRNTVSPWAGQSFGKKRLHKVRGQRANPWIDEACQSIAFRHGAR